MDTYTHFGVTGSSYRSPPPVPRHDATRPCYTARRLTRHRAAAAGRRSRRDPVLAPGRTLSTPHPRHGLGNHTPEISASCMDHESNSRIRNEAIVDNRLRPMHLFPPMDRLEYTPLCQIILPPWNHRVCAFFAPPIPDHYVQTKPDVRNVSQRRQR